MADSVASLDVVIDSSGAEQGAARVQRSIEDIKASANSTAKSLKSTFSSLKTTLATIFGGYMLKNIASSFLEAARSAEDYRTSIRAVSSSIEEADATFDRIRKWAAVNPVDTDEAVGAFVRLRTAAVENSEGALNAIADLSTVMHADMRDVASAVVTTETETLRNLGIILDRTGKQATIQMGNVRKTVEKDLDSIRAGIISVIEESIGGAMQKAADTYTGVIDTMSGMWTDFQQDVMGISGEGPFDAVKDSLIDLRDEWEAFTKTDDYTRLVQEIQGSLVSAINTFRNGIELAGDAFLLAKDNAEELKGVVTALVAYKITLGLTDLIRNLRTAITLTKILEATKLATPAGLAAGAVGAIAGIAVYSKSKKDMKELQEQTARTEDAIASLNAQLANASKEQIKDAIGEATTGIKQVEDEIASLQSRLSSLSTEFQNETTMLGKREIGQEIKAIEDQITSAQKLLEVRQKSREHLLSMLNGAGSEVSTVSGDSGKVKSGTTSTSTKSAAELLVENIRDQMKYLGKDGNDFLSVLDRWQAKLAPLSEDWKKITDLKMDIFGENFQRDADNAERVMEKIQKQKDDAKELAAMYARADSEYLSSLGWENQQGLLSNAGYFDTLMQKVKELGLETKNVFNWTDTDKSFFAAAQQAAVQGFTEDLEKLNNSFKTGDLEDYKSQLDELTVKWGNLPLVTTQAQEAMTSMTQKTKNDLYDLNELTVQWTKDFQEGIADAIVEGNNLGDTLTSIGKEMEKVALKMILFGENGTSGIFGGAFGWLKGLFNAKGNVFGPSGHIAKYAKGGIPGLPSLHDYVNSVVSSPKLFGFSRGVGMMGEGSGPEAIMPLTRNSRGELAVKTVGGGASAPSDFTSTINITVQNNGNGEMTDEQAQKLGQMVNEQIRMQVAEEMYKYQRSGIFRNAFAR